MLNYKDRKIVAFDMDGTVTESLTPMDFEMAKVFSDLLKEHKVAVISGAAFKSFKLQILDTLSKDANLKNLVILSGNGTSFYMFENSWKSIYEDKLSEAEKKKIREVIIETLKKLDVFKGFEEKKGAIDDKSGQLTLKMISGDAPLEEKLAWDPDKIKREPIRKLLQEKLPDYEVKIGGTTSIDITPKGVDKGYAIKKVMEYFKAQKEEVLFLGDAIFPGGNDYAAAQVVDGIKVSGPEETKEVIRNILQ